jgi:hypothetical protein
VCSHFFIAQLKTERSTIVAAITRAIQERTPIFAIVCANAKILWSSLRSLCVIILDPSRRQCFDFFNLMNYFICTMAIF